VTRLFRIAILLVAATWLAGCGEFRPSGPDYHYLRYKVRPKETLYSIAFRFGYDYREVAAWNNILPPYTIWPGQELLILSPNRSPGETARPAQVQAEDPKQPEQPEKTATTVRPPAEPRQAPPAPGRATTPVKWSWPTEGGKLINRFDTGGGRKGIDLSGRFGQPIRAAADGDVVYSGDGLIGYGKLVIIRHDDTYLSAYGHNRRLLVKEGQRVEAGQPIGEMGQHPKSGSILHFEIRRNGKPVDPLLYLPNQTP
jgi:lipoprotein NlpD